MTDFFSRATRMSALPQIAIELRDLVFAYVKQETVAPLRQLVRYVTFGILGALFLGLGAIMFGLAGLRAIQTETGDTFANDWSWAPYGITFLSLIFGSALVWRTRRGWRRRKGRD